MEKFQVSEFIRRVPSSEPERIELGFLMLTFWHRNYIFLILAHPVYKMWIIQEPNTLELWNKLHSEEEKTESIYRV